jgi:hypothetical protein
MSKILEEEKMEGFIRLNRTVNEKGILLSASDFKNKELLKSHLSKDPQKDYYQSLYVLGQEAKTFFDTNHSIAGYIGPAYSTELVFDLDDKNDLEQVRKDAIILLTRLSKEVGLGSSGIQKHCRVAFSGSKGLHIFVKTSKRFSPEELKNTCSAIAEGIPSFDPVIYNRTRLLRIVNTKHNTSGLYKIPVSLDLIKDKDGIKKILELAKSPQPDNDNTIPLEDLSLIDKYVELVSMPKKPTVTKVTYTEVEGIRGLDTIDFKLGKSIPKCLYALSQGIMVPNRGTRNHIFLHLANFYRNQGHSIEVVEGILKGIATSNHKLYPEFDKFSDDEIKNQVLKMAFSDEKKINPGGFGVKPDDEIFSNYCHAIKDDHRCAIHNKKHGKTVVQIHECAEEFQQFAANFEDNVIPLGIPFVDKHMKIARGTTNLLVGGSGVGKTQICFSAMENASNRGLNSIFFSMDMHKNLVFQRLIQRYSGYAQDEIFEAFKNRDIKKIEYMKDLVAKNFKNTYMDFSGTISLDDIEERIDRTEQNNGLKIDLVVIDYASRLAGPYSDRFQNESYNAIKSKDTADRVNAAFIILNQISRAQGDGSTPLRSKRVIKGSSDYEESSSNVITLWRPFMGLDGHYCEEYDRNFEDRYLRLFLAKNRMGEEKELLLHWDGALGKIKELTEDELVEYNKYTKPMEGKTFKYKKGSQ